MDELDSKSDLNPTEGEDNKPPLDSPRSVPLVTDLAQKTKVSKTNDDDTLINLHIGNPLRRITEILEDIKKQKAFSFTLKGSLGIMGVMLTLSLFGFFGTTHVLCDKGVQTHIGRVKVLQVTDIEPDHVIARAQRMIKYFSTFFQEATKSSPRYRYILEISDNTTIHLNRGRDASLSPFKDLTVYATGTYDSCSKEMTIETPEAIEEYKEKLIN